MNTFRSLARPLFTSRMGTFMVARRTGIHQSNEGDDLTWLEAEFDMSAEERMAYKKQWALLKSQAESINKKYEEEHKNTREQFQEHQDKSHSKIADLEAKIDSLMATIADLKKQQ